MPDTRVMLQDVQSYIRTTLPALLKADLRAHRLVREADVECATYMHLRHLLDADTAWTVTARRHIHQTGRFIDIVIFQDAKPKIAIEIKWGLKSIDPKDRESLRGAIEELGVNKAYWISASVLGPNVEDLDKAEHEKYSLHAICVRADLDKKQEDAWKEFRDKLRSKLTPGSGRKLKAQRNN